MTKPKKVTRIVRNDHERLKHMSYLSQRELPYTATEEDGEKVKRSTATNRLYWLWVTQAANECGDTKEGVHYDLKRRFLLKIYYRDSNSFAGMCDSIKALQNLDLQHYDMIAKEVVGLVSTAKATDVQMSEYLNDIYRFYLEQGLCLKTPDELRFTLNND